MLILERPGPQDKAPRGVSKAPESRAQNPRVWGILTTLEWE